MAEWIGVLSRVSKKRVLIDQKAKKHVHAIAVAVVLQDLVQRDIGLSEDDRVAPAPLQEVSQLPEVRVGIVLGSLVRAFESDYESSSMDPNPGDAELKPVAHDVLDFLPNRQICDVEVGLMV